MNRNSLLALAFASAVYTPITIPVLASTTAVLTPSSDGNYLQWTPSSGTTHYTLVNESLCNGTTNYVSTGTVGNKDSYGVDISSVGNGASISQVAVVPCASRNNSGNGSGTMDVFYRWNGVDSSATGAYAISGTNPVEFATSTYSNLSLFKTSTSTLEIGSVFSSGTKGARLSRIATVLTYSITAPTAPSAFTVTNISSSENDLSWTDNSNNEIGFKVYRSQNGAAYVQIATTTLNSVSYSDTGIVANQTYSYEVAAYNDAGTVLSNAAMIITSNTIPAAPSNLVTAMSGPDAVIDWIGNSPNASGFSIERSIDDVTFQAIATTSPNLTDSSSIAYDSATSALSGVPVNSFTFSYTVTSTGANRLLMVGLRVSGTAGTIQGVTYGGVPLTLLNSQGTGDNNGSAYLYYLVAPRPGQNNVVVTTVSAQNIGATAVSYTGVSQNTPVQVHASSSGTESIPGTAYSQSLTSTTVNSWVVMMAAFDGSGPPDSPIQGSTQRGTNLGTAGMYLDSNGVVSGSSSLGLSTQTTNANYASVMAVLRPVDAPSSTYTDAGVGVGVYYYRIRAFNSQGYSSYSNAGEVNRDIVFDNVTSSDQVGPATSVTFSHVVGSATYTILFVAVRTRAAAQVSGVTYGGIAMTFVDSIEMGDAVSSAFVYYLLNPPSGANDVIVSLGTADYFGATAISYAGVNQSNPIDVEGTNTAGVATGQLYSQSVTTTAAADWTLMIGVCDGSGSPGPFPASGYIQRGGDFATAGLVLDSGQPVESTGTNSLGFYDNVNNPNFASVMVGIRRD